MLKYENQTCDVCGQVFDKDDDIVVCPECGTPHHRQCWFDNGGCINQHRHAEGFEWTPAVPETPAASQVCPECGTQVSGSAVFCENCGKLLKANQETATQTFTTPGGGRIEIHQLPPFGMMTGTENAVAGDIEGVPLRDMAAFIGPNAHYYIFKFKRMIADARYKPFNFTAFLFRPLWFLYRKLWKMAILAAIVNFTTSMPTAISLAVETGALASSYMFPGIETLMTAGQIVNFIANVIFGFIAIPMYKKDTVKRLKQIRLESGSDNNLYYSKLMAQCGPSKIGTAVIFAFSVYYIFTMFL